MAYRIHFENEQNTVFHDDCFSYEHNIHKQAFTYMKRGEEYRVYITYNVTIIPDVDVAYLIPSVKLSRQPPLRCY